MHRLPTPLARSAAFLLLIGLFLAACSSESQSTESDFPGDDQPPTEEVSPQPDLLVSSRNTNSVKRFDGDTGEFIEDFIPPNSGGLSATQEVAFGPDGNLFVSGRGNQSILKFDGQTGAYIGTFTSGYELDNPTKMTFGPDGLLYVSQWREGPAPIVRFNAETGAFIDAFTERGILQAMGHAWDEQGRLYVASFANGVVHRYATDGAFLDTFVPEGSLQGPANLWFDDQGNLLVVDWTEGAIKRFDGDTGSLLGVFITGLERAEGVANDDNNLLYVCDWQRNVVNQYGRQSGSFIKQFTNGGDLRQPNSLAFMPGDSVE